MSTEDADEAFAAALRQTYGRPKLATGAPDGRRPDATRGKPGDLEQRRAVREMEVSTRHAEDLLRAANRKREDQ